MKHTSLLWAVTLSVWPLITNSQTKKESRPNIILIMVDDMVYSDIGVYGSEIQTPNRNKLASEGIRFKEFYNNAIYYEKKWELCDLEADPGETTNVPEQFPEVVHELSFDFTQWSAGTGVVKYETIKPKAVNNTPAESTTISRGTN